MEPEVKKHNYLTIIATVLVMLFVTAGAVGGVWYYMEQQNKENKQTSRAPVSSNKEGVKNSLSKPSNFKTIELNGVFLSYPNFWGNLEKKTTKEYIVDTPEMSFRGEYAYSENKISPYLTVNDARSYEKSEIANKVLQSLKNTYNDRAVSMEALYTSNALLPPANAGTSFYAVRYVESYDKKWRGHWFVGTISQDISARPVFVAALYNKEIAKVVSIKYEIDTAMSSVLQERIQTVYGGTDNNAQQQLVFDIENYVRGMYAVDTEVKKSVDEIGLVMCKLIGKK